jgi:hypothetical protein
MMGITRRGERSDTLMNASAVTAGNHITRITCDVLLAVGLSLYFLSDLFEGLCFVSLANYFNIAVGKQNVTRFPVFPGSFFLVI